jgi:hypothetical protein
VTLLQGVGGVFEGLTKVVQEFLDAADGAMVAFDFAGPAVVGGVGGEGVLRPCVAPVAVARRPGS